jgi:dTDP-4-dehydrorhamnose reductase
MMDQIEAKVPTIYAVTDKFGSPTYAPDFAVLFEELITGNDWGTYHTVSGGSCSRYDVAKEMLSILGREDIVLEPASSLFFQTTFFAPRPPSEAMRNYVLDLQSRNNMRGWKEALADYLKDWA